jgi:phosphoglycolate phosphatase
MELKAVVFDFDGTIADTLGAIYKLSIELAREQRLVSENNTLKNLDHYRNKYPHQILRELKVPLIKLPFVLKSIREKLTKELPTVPSFNGIHEVITNVKKAGLRTILLSSNTKKNIQVYLQNHKWENLFDSVYTGVSIFGKSFKLKKVLKKEKLQNTEAVYIGDEVRDIKACKKVNIKVIAVSWGFHIREYLERNKPDFLVDKPRQILEIVRNLREKVM